MRQYFYVGAVCAALMFAGCEGCKAPGGDLLPGTDGGEDPNACGACPDAGDGFEHSTTKPDDFVVDGTAPGTVAENVQPGPTGGIILGGGQTSFHFAWIANNDQNTVSKFDTRTGKEVARYVAAIPEDGLGNKLTQGIRGNQNNYPSRTAVDLNGDVWVANRAPRVAGSVTKIANEEGACKERNGTPGIQTSRDANQNGQIDPGEMVTPTDWTDPTQYDECILFSTPVGSAQVNAGADEFKARAIAISRGYVESAAGDIWVGIWKDNEVIKLNSVTGEQMPVYSGGPMAINIGFGAYGAAVDSKQRLFVASSELSSSRLALIDTSTGTLVSNNINPGLGAGMMGNYGIGIDGKNRVWLAGLRAANRARAFRYDHDAATDKWKWFDFDSARSNKNTELDRPRGIAADDQGLVWMSADVESTGSQLIAFDQETGAVRPFTRTNGTTFEFLDATDASTTDAIGVGIDSDGHPWVNNRSGNAMRVHRVTGEVLKTPQQAYGLYTYSDFTGFQLRNFTAPRGTFRKVLQACPAADLIVSSWGKLVWDASVPPKTTLNVNIKVARSEEGLQSATAFKAGPFTQSPTDLEQEGLPKGRDKWILIEFTLTSEDRQSTPTLKSFDVAWACAADIG